MSSSSTPLPWWASCQAACTHPWQRLGTHQVFWPCRHPWGQWGCFALGWGLEAGQTVCKCTSLLTNFNMRKYKKHLAGFRFWPVVKESVSMHGFLKLSSCEGEWVFHRNQIFSDDNLIVKMVTSWTVSGRRLHLGVLPLLALPDCRWGGSPLHIKYWHWCYSSRILYVGC